jgi:hypothetical protein
MSPVPVQPSTGPYEYTAWPAWRHGPDGKSEIFQRPEDVPDGWVTLDEKNAGVLAEAEETGVTGEDKLRQLTADQRKSAIDGLVDGNTQAELVEILTGMAETNDSVEFLPSWPKPKLAETIVDNGGPPTPGDDEDEG